MKKFLFAVATILVLGVGAKAADLPLKTSSPVYNPAHTWTGLYFGGTIGVGSHRTELNDGNADLECCSAMVGKALGFNAGLTAGYNWQFGSFVLGAEGDWNFSTAKTSNISGYTASYFKTETNWFATARVRGGVTIDNLLVYVTGGPALVDAKHTGIYSAEPCGVDRSGCATKTSLGLAVGGGIEAKLTKQLSAKVEYLYLDMPTAQVGYPQGQAYGFSDSAHIGRFGLNYQFF